MPVSCCTGDQHGLAHPCKLRMSFCSCMVYLDREGKPTVIRTRGGDRMPSHVAFTKFGRVVGISAKTQVTL